MSNIKEDYVSFNAAKLLKNKGFDGGCDMYYTETGSVTYTQLKYNHNEIKNRYSRPTLQMAMKWLREKHNIHIEIHYLSESDDYSYVINNVSNGGIMCVNGFNSYENAVEAAIIECLTNLI